MFLFSHACMRKPGPEMVRGLSLHFNGVPNFQKALGQHIEYARILETCGVLPILCPAIDQFPDGCFPEDTHLILKEAVIRLNPGASSRKGEPDSLRSFLPQDRPYLRLPQVLCVDGGDILQVGQKIFVGLSDRTQPEAVHFLRSLLQPHGYEVIDLPVSEGLHLKSGLTALNDETFIALPSFSSIPKIQKLGNLFTVPGSELLAANILPLNDSVLLPPGCPETRRFIEKTSPEKKIIEVDTSEFNKIDGALTCLSLRW
jgi:dimethylargininase